MKRLAKAILPVVFISALALNQGKADGKNLFMQFKGTKFLQAQQDSTKSDSVKTASDSLQLQQKTDTLQTVQAPKILDEMALPENMGGGKITLFVGKVRHTYKNEEGSLVSVSVLIKELGPGAKLAGYLENYNGKKWVAIAQPDEPDWDGWALILLLPGLEGHDFIRK